MSNKKWVSVIKVQGDLQAELLRGLLEAQEIPVLLSREGAGKAFGINIGPLGEVDVLVPDRNVQNARSILEMYKSGSLEIENGDED